MSLGKRVSSRRSSDWIDALTTPFPPTSKSYAHRPRCHRWGGLRRSPKSPRRRQTVPMINLISETNFAALCGFRWEFEDNRGSSASGGLGRRERSPIFQFELLEPGRDLRDLSASRGEPTKADGRGVRRATLDWPRRKTRSSLDSISAVAVDHRLVSKSELFRRIPNITETGHVVKQVSGRRAQPSLPSQTSAKQKVIALCASISNQRGFCNLVRCCLA